MGDWVYTLRQREPKVEIPGGTELRAPVAELTSQKLPDSSTHTLAEAKRAHIIATLRQTKLGRRRAEWSGRQTRPEQA
jgi:hypothetical protein